MKFDTKGVTEWGTYETLEPGFYLAKVYEASLGKSRSDVDMYKITFEITEGVYEGKKVFLNLVTRTKEGKIFSYMLHVLRALGFKENEEGVLEADPKDMPGLRAVVETSIREYEGNKQTGVKDVLPASEWGSIKEIAKFEEMDPAPF